MSSRYRRRALYSALPDDYEFWTTSDLIAFLTEYGDTPIWIDNFWQPFREFSQRPVQLIAASDDGIHLG